MSAMDIHGMDLNAIHKTGQWVHGICGCFDNWTICCITYWVPCVTFGQSVERIQGKSCFLYGFFSMVPVLACYMLTKQRGLIRELRGIPGKTLYDCCWTGWCSCCTLSQEGQEIEHMREDYLATRPVAIFVNQAGYPATATVTTAGYPVSGYDNQAMGYVGQVQQPYPPPMQVAQVEPEKSENMERM